MLHAGNFFSLDSTAHTALFEGTIYVWEAIPRIRGYVRHLLETDFRPNIAGRDFHPSVAFNGDAIYIDETAHIEPGVYIEAPAVIGAHCEVRQGAYLRGGVLLAEGAIAGHTTEIKNSVLLEHAAAPHFSYVGDSILGARVNLGAGSKLSNLAVNSIKHPITGARPHIFITIDGVSYDTGLTKMGAILGDDVQIGCNAVTNPGCVVGARTWVYPLVSLTKGYYPPDHLIKLRQEQKVMIKRVRDG